MLTLTSRMNTPQMKMPRVNAGRTRCLSTSSMDATSPLSKASISRMWVRSGTMNSVSGEASPLVGSPSAGAMWIWISRPTKKIGAA